MPTLLMSKCVASSRNHGFIRHEDTSSLVSNSTPRNPTSHCRRRRFRILPTLPLTTHPPSPFVTFRSPSLQIRMRVVGSAPFTMSYTCISVPRIVTLRSLHLTLTSSEVLDLIGSFPILEDLSLVAFSHESDVWNTPSTSPKLTGSLELGALGGIRPAARRLLGLPGGLHFTKISISCLDGDVEPTMDLVSRCSDTLKSLVIYYRIQGAFSFSFYERSMPYRHLWV
jgi:hypothetical protein